MFSCLGQVVMNVSVVLPALGEGVWRRNGALLWPRPSDETSPLCLPSTSVSAAPVWSGFCWILRFWPHICHSGTNRRTSVANKNSSLHNKLSSKYRLEKTRELLRALSKMLTRPMFWLNSLEMFFFKVPIPKKAPKLHCCDQKDVVITAAVSPPPTVQVTHCQTDV